MSDLPYEISASTDVSQSTRRIRELADAHADLAAARGRAPKRRQRLNDALLACWIDGCSETALADLAQLTIVALRAQIAESIATATAEQLSYDEQYSGARIASL